MGLLHAEVVLAFPHPSRESLLTFDGGRRHDQDLAPSSAIPSRNEAPRAVVTAVGYASKLTVSRTQRIWFPGDVGAQQVLVGEQCLPGNVG
ncbi:hypothetical protein FQZ97_1025600 [compost metagenome]